MTVGRWKLMSAAAAIGLGSGCVDRRFVVETNVPGAQVAVDGSALGPSPADGRREYPGWYTFTAGCGGNQDGDIQDVGGDIRVAEFTDPFGNRFGLIQNPNFDPAAVR